MTIPDKSRWSAPVIVGWVGVLLVWEAAVRSGWHSGLFLPPPSRIVTSLGALIADGSLEVHLASTLLRITTGLIIGGGLGLALGLGMGISTGMRRAVDPVVAALHPIPRLAFFPLLIVVFGVSEYSKVAAVALGSLFPMLLNTMAGVRSMNPVHFELARNFGATRRQLFTRVLLPGSMPLMLTGFRLSANVAFHSTIGVEMIGSQTGIGAMLWLSWQTFRIDRLYALLALIAAIGIGLAALVRWITRRSAPWYVDLPPSA